MSRRAAAALALAALAGLALAACKAPPGGAGTPEGGPFRSPPPLSERATAFLDTLEERTFHYFWDLSDPRTGLTPDRWPTKSFASVGAVGFALTAYPIGVERGYVPRAQAVERVRRTLRFFWTARQDTAAAGCTGYRGFFYHFLDPATGARFETVELSTMDTALLLAGALFCQSYFAADDPAEGEIRALAESIYARADWRWAEVRAPMVVLGWDPEHGFLPYDWRGMNESLLVPILALGSPTHPLEPEAWSWWASACRWGTFEGQAHVGFAPLFGHQYPQVWLDLRGVRDSLMRAHDLDWFENSRRATLAQQRYAIANPLRFAGYGELLWGLTACDGPLDGEVTIDGTKRAFRTYAARGASFDEIVDDGTVSPSAAAGSIAFAPEIVVPTLIALRETYGDNVFSTYGFMDALNPTLRVPAPVHQGRVVPGVGWFDTDYLGIDQGPILAMTENYRTGLVWRTLERNPHVVAGLTAAGFRGGWLDSLDSGR